MDFHIKTIVFNNTPEVCFRFIGEDYINYFLKYSFPSLISPNNIEVLVKNGINIEHHIYTHTQDEVDRINNALGWYSEFFPIKVQIAPVDESRYADPEMTSQNEFWEYFTTKNPGNAPTLFSNASHIWSDGSISYIMRSLSRGNVAVFPPFIRVSSETILPELNKIKKHGILTISPLQAQRLALMHLIPYQGALHHKSKYYHPWAECLFVPVGTEGVLLYHFARVFQAFIPNNFAVTDSLYIKDNYYNIKTDIVRFGSLCMGMEVQPIIHKERLDTLRQGILFDARNVASFLKHPRYMSSFPFNIEAFKIPLRIYLIDNPTKELWDNAEKEIEKTIIKEIFDYNGGIQGYPVISMSDKILQIEALEWLEPVFNGKFKQVALEYLREN